MAASLVYTYMQHAMDTLSSINSALDEVGDETTHENTAEKQSKVVECIKLSQMIPVCLWQSVLDYFSAL